MSTRPARAKATTSGGDMQEVRLDVLVDAGLEVAVAREHGRRRRGRSSIDGLLDRRASGPELPMQVVQP
jgi:hypothetical protein